MKKIISVVFILSFYLSGCYPDCEYEENFRFTGDVPDINLAISDSVIIDMSKYWKADIACDTYTPIIKQAKGNKDLIEIRSIDEFLILKGLQKGNTEIKVIAEKRIATDDTADCIEFNASSNPLSFSVTVDSPTNFESDDIITDVNNRILSFEVTPRNFSKGDTVLIEFEATKSEVSWSVWFSESGSFISDKIFYPVCQDGFEVPKSRQVELIVETDNNFIEGYAHISFARIETQKTGTYFHIKSED